FAHNYYLLAQKNAFASRDTADSCRTSLLVSVNLYLNGQPENARSSFSKCIPLADELDTTVRKELWYREHLRSPEVFEFFCEMLETTLSAQNDPAPGHQSDAYSPSANLIQAIVLATIQVYEAIYTQSPAHIERRVLQVVLETSRYFDINSRRFRNLLDMISSRIAIKEGLPLPEEDPEPGELDELSQLDLLITRLLFLHVPESSIDDLRSETKLRKLSTIDCPEAVLHELQSMDRRAIGQFIAMDQRTAKFLRLVTVSATTSQPEFHGVLSQAIVTNSSDKILGELLTELSRTRQTGVLPTILTDLAKMEPEFIAKTMVTVKFFDQLEPILIVAMVKMEAESASAIWKSLALCNIQTNTQRLFDLSNENHIDLMNANPIADALLATGSVYEVVSMVRYAFKQSAETACALLSRMQEIRSSKDFIDLLALLIQRPSSALVPMYLEKLESANDQKPSVESKAGQLALGLWRVFGTKNSDEILQLIRLSQQLNFKRVTELLPVAKVACEEEERLNELKSKHEFGSANHFSHALRQVSVNYGLVYVKNLIGKFEESGDASLSARIAFELFCTHELGLDEIVSMLLAANNIKTLTWFYFYTVTNRQDVDRLTQTIRKQAPVVLPQSVSPVDIIDYFAAVASASFNCSKQGITKPKDWITSVNENVASCLGKRSPIQVS
ncbi:MAG: hypothetical protein K2Z81_05925, partial [Cyanobacteria bacterium]|nr:hypothetical protein [Cyanobacteriota bacterium]